jgi:3-oxoacyl-[acyl-carrier protein] reductase
VRGLLEGKVALVTGASRGIGRAISLRLSLEGIKIVLVARGQKELKEVEMMIKEKGGEALSVVCDATREDEVKKCVQIALDEFGRVDFLINNVGVFPPELRKGLEEVTMKEWSFMIDVNLTSAFIFTREVLPLMKRQRSGYIVNISSMAGVKVSGKNRSVYSTPKFGLMGLTMATLHEAIDYGIRVTAICPGIVKTEFQPPERLKKYGEDVLMPEDVAETVLFLLKLPGRVIIPEIHLIPIVQKEYL